MRHISAIRRTGLVLGMIAALVPSGVAHAGPAVTTPIGVSASYSLSLSADGRFVAFSSSQPDLVAGDTNGVYDVFVRDRQTGETTRVSVDSQGVQGNNISRNPSISADGRFVAFESGASNLVPGDAERTWDVFLHDRQTGQTVRVSKTPYRFEDSNGTSLNPSISADGRFVAFESVATNLVSNDTNGVRDVFVYDVEWQSVSRASIDQWGREGNGASERPSISADGHFVAFSSKATNLAVWPDTNGVDDVFVHDRYSRNSTRVSWSNGVEANAPSRFAAISANGRYVTYVSGASNLVPGDGPEVDVFRYDSGTGKTVQVNLRSDGTHEGGASSEQAVISADGRYVAFTSGESTLVPDDTNAHPDVFLRDVQAGTTTRVSVDSAGGQGDGYSQNPALTGDGRHVAFLSTSTNLGGRIGDIYVRDLGN